MGAEEGKLPSLGTPWRHDFAGEYLHSFSRPSTKSLGFPRHRCDRGSSTTSIRSEVARTPRKISTAPSGRTSHPPFDADGMLTSTGRCDALTVWYNSIHPSSSREPTGWAADFGPKRSQTVPPIKRGKCVAKQSRVNGNISSGASAGCR